MKPQHAFRIDPIAPPPATAGLDGVFSAQAPAARPQWVALARSSSADSIAEGIWRAGPETVLGSPLTGPAERVVKGRAPRRFFSPFTVHLWNRALAAPSSTESSLAKGQPSSRFRPPAAPRSSPSACSVAVTREGGDFQKGRPHRASRPAAERPPRIPRVRGGLVACPRPVASFRSAAHEWFGAFHRSARRPARQ